jgi:hypothetical protein
MPPEHPLELPDRVRRLLLGPIDSFEKLEIVIALHARGDKPLPLDALESRVGAPLSVFTMALDELFAAGIIERQADGTSLIAPGCDRTALDELTAAWSTNRTAVLEVMTARAVERMRASVARAFADAFALRRGSKSDDGDHDG